MSLRCRLFGMHKWEPIKRPLETPKHRALEVPLPGPLWQHPATWRTLKIPYTATYDVEGYRCARCSAVKGAQP